MKLAYAVEKRDEPVVEDVEEVAQGGVLAPRALDYEFGRGRVQRPHRARESHEVDGHLGRAALARRRLHVGHVARGEREADRRLEAHGLARRLRPLADGRWRRGGHLKESHRLEEVEAVRLLVEPLIYRMIFSPAAGGHSFQTPSRCRLLMRSCVNELTEA